MIAQPLRGSLIHFTIALTLLASIAGCDSGAGTDRAMTTVAEPGVDASICDADNGGLTLPGGFCAVVVSDTVGRTRHIAVRENGDVYAILRRRSDEGGIVAMRDTSGDGKADLIRMFGDVEGTGIDIRNGYLYVASDTSVHRFRLGDELVPSDAPDLVVGGFLEQGSHASKSFTFDGGGSLYVNVGAPSNACQQQPRTPGSPGMDPCPQLERQAGIWRFDADALNQRQVEDGVRFSTGIRNAVAIDWNPASDRVYVVQHGRDQLQQLWGDMYSEEEGVELPAEEMFVLDEGADFGWPTCYYDHRLERKVLSPEYGGDGEQVERCAEKQDPIAVFPAHYAPNDLLFYTGDQFPEPYRGGAFIAFHGSWNRSPRPQRGYQVAFQPFSDGEPSGEWETFADGFAGAETLESPGDAEYRPTGLAIGPDGSLYISDDQKGRIWRVVYTE